MAHLADQQAESDCAEIRSLAFGVPPSSQLAGRLHVDGVSKFVVSNAGTSAESPKLATTAFAMAACACSNRASVTCCTTR